MPGQYLAVDPKGRAVMIGAVEKQKLVYILNRLDCCVCMYVYTGLYEDFSFLLYFRFLCSNRRNHCGITINGLSFFCLLVFLSSRL